MATPEQIRNTIPELAKDIRLNLQMMLQPGGSLTPAQRWGRASLTSAASRRPFRAAPAAAMNG